MNKQSVARTSSPPDSNSLIAEIPYLRRYARALTRNNSAADDLVQDAVLRAITGLNTFRPGTYFRAWLLTIVYHCFIDDSRKNKRSRENDKTGAVGMSGLYTAPNQISNLQLAEVAGALESLPEAQRATVILIALEDMTYEEAAKVMDVPVGTIRSRLSRARHAMMKTVEGLSLADISPESGITRRAKRKGPPATSLRPGSALYLGA